MVRYGNKITVPFPRESVWKLMSDWTNLAKWDVNIKRCEVVPSETKPYGLGTKYSCTFDFKGNKTEADYKCVEYEEGERAVFAATSRFVRSRDTLEFTEMDDGKATEVSAEFQLHLRGLLNPLSFLLNGAMQETGPVVMKDMEAFIKESLSE